MKKIEVIREVPFFKPLRDEDLRELAEICGVQGYVAGTKLFSQGDPSESFFIIVAGEVEIRLHPPDGSAPKIIVLADGDFFGEMGVMRNAPRSGDAFIKSDAVLLKIMKTDFDRLMAVNKFFSGMVMESFLERSRQHLTTRAAPPPPAPPPPTIANSVYDDKPRGRVITLFSPCGGCGTTFLACNIATKLTDFTKSPVLLVDADLQFGTVELMMGVKPSRNTSELCQGIQIRPHDVLSYIVKPKEGPHILPRPRNPEEAELFTPEKMRTILELAAREYQYIVIDTQSMMDEPNLTILDVSNEIFMVLAPEIPALSRMVAWLRLMEKLRFPHKRIRMICNRHLKEDNTISISQIEQRLGQKLLGIVPYDYKTILTSVNTGHLVVEGKPLCPVSIEISNLAREALFAQQEDDDAEAQGKKAKSSFSIWNIFGGG